MSTPHFRNHQDSKRDFEIQTGRVVALATTFYDGTTTECRVSITSLGTDDVFYGEGYAFLAPGDVYSSVLGQRIAYLRALQDALDDALLSTIAEVQQWESDAEEDTINEACCETEEYDEPEAIPVNNCVFCANSGADLSKPCPFSKYGVGERAATPTVPFAAASA